MPRKPASAHAAKSEPAKTVTKAEAVRQALAKGIEAPGEISDFLKSQYGLDMPKQMASTYKSQQKARDLRVATIGVVKRGPKPKGQLTGQIITSSKHYAGGDTDIISSLESLKPLIARYGPDRVKRLVDLLG
jgi:hypothetical protein